MPEDDRDAALAAAIAERRRMRDERREPEPEGTAAQHHGDRIADAVAEADAQADHEASERETLSGDTNVDNLQAYFPVHTAETLPFMERVAIAEHLVATLESGDDFERAAAFLGSLVPDVRPPKPAP